MRSEPRHPRAAAWLLAAVLGCAVDTASAQALSNDTLTRAQVEAAAVEVAQDPNLPGTKKDRTLQFKEWQSERAQEPDVDLPQWLKQFALWVSEAGRVAMWAVGVVGVALFLVGLRHWVKVRAEARGVRPRGLPSHVGELDIRPETLPDRIGAAARTLWQRGEHRAALSLLYRGALSRLVHTHAVPIRAASTEGDCLRLARGHLGDAPERFFAQLVTAWQLAVYGGRLPEADQVLALCDAFDTQLARRTEAAA